MFDWQSLFALKKARKQPTTVWLGLEALEDRYCPANFLWDPPDPINDYSWTNPNNWDRPPGQQLPGPGDSAVFDGRFTQAAVRVPIGTQQIIDDIREINGYNNTLFIDGSLDLRGGVSTITGRVQMSEGAILRATAR
jgi:hypothetical protein